MYVEMYVQETARNGSRASKKNPRGSGERMLARPEWLPRSEQTRTNPLSEPLKSRSESELGGANSAAPRPKAFALKAILILGCFLLLIFASSKRTPAQEFAARPGARAALIAQTLERLRNASDLDALHCLWFLVDNAPESDVSGPTRVSPDLLATTIEDALATRRANPHWPIPWPIFLDGVLPFATLSEPRDDWNWRRKLAPFMSNELRKAKPMNLSEAIDALNARAWSFTSPPIHFQASGPNTINAYSVKQVVEQKYSSCTGESVFLVAALRSVGIPARVAGVPHWQKGPAVCPQGDASPPCGNHNWVEAWTGEDWAFVDQNSGSPGLNHAFFFPKQTNELSGDKLHAVYASSWQASAPTRFPLVFDPSAKVPAYDRTKWYQHMGRSSSSSSSAEKEGSR